jgi:hypothetical protein
MLITNLNIVFQHRFEYTIFIYNFQEFITKSTQIFIPGNLTVLIIYRQKYSKSVYRTIIWNLALVDFVFCTLTFPFNIGRLIRYYTFTELWVCKMFTTIIIFFVVCSSHLLVTLAIHRFRQDENCQISRNSDNH